MQLKNRNYLTITIKIQFISGDMAHKTHRRYREIDRNTENTIKTGNRSHHSINSPCIFCLVYVRIDVTYSATSAQHVRPSGIRCRWPDDLQRSAR